MEMFSQGIKLLGKLLKASYEKEINVFDLFFKGFKEHQFNLTPKHKGNRFNKNHTIKYKQLSQHLPF